MSNTAYYLAWLAAGLAAVAVVSAWITRQLRLRLTRRVMAARLFDALARYAAWAGSQRRAMLFQPDAWGGDGALEELRAIQRRWFAPLGGEAARLQDAHARLVDFLWTQQVLRLKDAEAWLLSEPDAKFMALWRLHRDAARDLGEKLGQLAGVSDVSVEAEFDPGSAFLA